MHKQKKWNVTETAEYEADAKKLSEALGIEYVTALLLCIRGYRTPSDARVFLELEHELFHDPMLLTDMDKACERIGTAIRNKEKIVIYGDYDVDGVTSVSILYLYLKRNGADVGYYIPNRAGEGYGVNRGALEKLAADGMTLLITVDTGITAVEETEFAASIGCDVIITDHHECHEILPSAAAVINPKRKNDKYPFKELAGVGVAFKLISALEHTKRKSENGTDDGFLECVCEYIDLVAVGTIADVMPLRDENRLIVSMGLELMNRSRRCGIKALIEASDSSFSKQNKRVVSSLIGYTLAPRINAAGRISSASRAVELFLTDSEEEAAKIAQELCETNKTRQLEENKIVEQIKNMLVSDQAQESDPVIVLADDTWHHGVIGIVSSRITEKYSRPSILISFDGDVGKGSGRSIKGLNLVEALSSCSDLLVKYGGHELAAGLSIEKDKLPEFRRRINDYAKAQLGGEELVTTLDIDMELSPSEADLKLARQIGMLEPFGVSNPVPLFVIRDLVISEVIPIGSNKHTKLLFSCEGETLPAVYFGISAEELGFAPGDGVDIAFNLSVNEFRGVSSCQLLIRDIRPSEKTGGIRREQAERYIGIRNGSLPVLGDMPKREDFVSAYLRLKRELVGGMGNVSLGMLLYELNSMAPHGEPMSYIRLRLALDILADSGVIEMKLKEDNYSGFEMLEIRINNLEEKVNLEKSCLYKSLTEQM